MKNLILRHVIRMSKLFTYAFLFQCLTMGFLVASNGNAQIKSIEEVVVRLPLEGVPVKDAFKKIEGVSDFTFVYLTREVRNLPPITLEDKNQSLYEVLVEIARQSGLDFKQINHNIHVQAHRKGQEKPIVSVSNVAVEIRGTVTDENGEPIPGATVLVKGTNTGTATDIGGNFSLEAEEGSVLLISFIGYQSQQITVGNQTDLSITLLEDQSSLEEVVVVGYGTQQKSDLSGAVSSVKGEDMQKTPANTLIQSMQGRAAGVDIRAASNAPGGGMKIRIRGTNSINASSDPLYVIDGFPIDNINTTPGGAGNNALAADPLSSISPSEIESIEILKDASATAIYGARGANGVVLITTKRGKLGSAKIDFDYSLNVANVRKKLDLANAEELAILTNEWALNNNQPLIYDGINKPLPEELGEGTDWQDQIFRTALTHTYNLSLSGGTENTKYLVSGNYMDQDGIIIESNFKRGGLKFNLDQKINDRIKAGINLNVNKSINDAVPSDGSGFQHDSPLWNALTTTPVISVYDEDGNYLHNHDETVKILENPVSIARTRTDITETTRVLSNAFVVFNILDGLDFKTNFGTDVVNSKRDVYIPNTAETQALPNLGVASIGTIQSNNWLQEYTLSYNREVGAKHRINGLLGYTIQTRETESVLSRTDEFFTNKLKFNNLGIGANPRPSESNAVNTALLSYIGRLNYIYNDKYIFTGTVRRDGSSKFGDENKWGVFPSAAFAWRLGDENFIKQLNTIEDLKIRSSYGVTGNENISPYSSLALYNTVRPIINGAPVIGLVPNRIPNPDLKWEKTAQFNVGLDAAFAAGRINFSADYYIKKTDDLLLNVTIPNQSGYGTSVQNIGSVENRGFEFQIGINNTFGELTWNSSFNMSFNRNKLLSLADGTDRLLFGIGRGESAHGQTIAEPGKPLGLFYGYRFAGIWQTEEEIIAAGNTVGGINRPGLPKYADLNGDGFRRNDDDREVIGDPNPDFIYGFSNDFSYKNLTLSVFIHGVYGNEIADMNRIGLLAQPQKHNVYKVFFEERWTGPGTSNTIEAPITNAGEWKNFSDRDVLDGSFLRVKTINLSYNLPPGFPGMNRIRNAQLYVAGDNLFTFTDYTGFDPEVDLYASSNVQMGVDNGAYPMSKSVRIGVKLGF
ncbi:SusC/RagA family TonB-linked outer membrane protein [Cyclobacterium roseum]|uniref:SusC/RagA family TonB-linked outer membrane protein n=1 Tax=Cyclobacterium roseum TaxID=2666137 RepID=UPI0013908BB7|nr:TonB-dependent receptor [Cyclobacterium roseum]